MRATCRGFDWIGYSHGYGLSRITDTEMLKQHLGGDTDLMVEIGSKNGFGRLIKPEEIAGVVTWAHESPVVNGSVIHANLGQIEH